MPNRLVPQEHMSRINLHLDYIFIVDLRAHYGALVWYSSIGRTKQVAKIIHCTPNVVNREI